MSAGVALLDCYVDEPSCLGVPPYISPYPRTLAGAVRDAGGLADYLTIDHVRRGDARAKRLRGSSMLVVIAGAPVPGKYLRSLPASLREIRAVVERFPGTKVLAGPLARFAPLNRQRSPESAALLPLFDLVSQRDGDALVYDVLTGAGAEHRSHSLAEVNRWSVLGAPVIREHPDFPVPLIVELEPYRGCTRYRSGGCSFCIEPLYGPPLVRSPDDMFREVEALHAAGARRFRLGGMTCTISYMARGFGDVERPVPDPGAVGRLLRAVRAAAPDLKVLHTDNADPAVIATHPAEAREVCKLLVEHCTPGNVLSFGMESADPAVIRDNNLNAAPEEVRMAVELVNSVGSAAGRNGLPALLPGINFIGGLKGETAGTYDLDYSFLHSILESGLLLRRINIREVDGTRARFGHMRRRREFRRFRGKVRADIDLPMLRRVLPAGAVVRDVYLEVAVGGVTYGRQIGTYPVLMGFPGVAGTGRFVDGAVTTHGPRSVAAVEYPFDPNTASPAAIASLPGIGRKRAARIVLGRPVSGIEGLKAVLDSAEAAEGLRPFLAG